MPKKISILLATCGLIVLGGCGKNELDGQTILREALGNSFMIESSASNMNIKIGLQNIEDANGTIEINVDGKSADALAFPSKFDYLIDTNFAVQTPEQNFNGSIKLAFKMIEDAFFAKVELPQLDDPTLTATIDPFAEFAGKWWRIPLTDLLGVENFEQTEITGQLENYKKLFVENDIFLAKNLSEDDENYLLEIEPNFDLILTRDFVENEIFPLAENYIENSELTPEEKIAARADLEIDDEMAEQIEKLRETAKNIWASGNFKWEMSIGKDDNFIHSFEMSSELDFAALGKILGNESATGKVILNIVSTSSEINQPQNIVAPEEFIDFDPMMIFGGAGMEIDEMPEITDSDSEIMPGEELNGMLDMELPEDQPIARPRE
jgi:hypothetical protein